MSVCTIRSKSILGSRIALWPVIRTRYLAENYRSAHNPFRDYRGHTNGEFARTISKLRVPNIWSFIPLSVKCIRSRSCSFNSMPALAGLQKSLRVLHDPAKAPNSWGLAADWPKDTVIESSPGRARSYVSQSFGGLSRFHSSALGLKSCPFNSKPALAGLQKTLKGTLHSGQSSQSVELSLRMSQGYTNGEISR